MTIQFSRQLQWYSPLEQLESYLEVLTEYLSTHHEAIGEIEADNVLAEIHRVDRAIQRRKTVLVDEQGRLTLAEPEE